MNQPPQTMADCGLRIADSAAPDCTGFPPACATVNRQFSILAAVLRRNLTTPSPQVGRALRCAPPAAVRELSARAAARSGVRALPGRRWRPLALFAAFLLAWAPAALSAQPKFAEVPGVAASGTNAVARAGTNSVPGATNLLAQLSTNSMDALDDKYRLAIGDRLSFRIVEDEEDPKPLFVTDSGELETPYIGRFPAVGKTCKALATALKAELEKEYYFQATVIVAVDLMTKSRGKVYLVGPVRAPGPQEIPSDEVLTLSKAILRAGGFSDFADEKSVKITRKAADGKGEDIKLTVNVSDILEKGKTETDVPLEPGDFIYIPERSLRF